MTNAHSKMGQMAVCCQNLTLGVLSSHSVLTRLKFFVFDGSTCVSFNMLYHNTMNFTVLALKG